MESNVAVLSAPKSRFVPQRLSLCLVALVFFMGGCSPDPASELVGVWRVDLEASKELDEFKDMDAAERSVMQTWLSAMECTISTGTMTMKTTLFGKESSDVATYRITKTVGTKLTLEVTDSKGSIETAEVDVAGDRLRLSAKGTPMIFERVR